MATVEVSISIRLDPAGGGHGISVEADTIYDDTFYSLAANSLDALAAAEDACRAALKACTDRAETEWRAEISR